MYKVYILESTKEGSKYVGITENISKRLVEHSTGSAKYSSSKRPYRLVWYCVFSNKTKALQFEKYLKQGSGFAFARKHLI